MKTSSLRSSISTLVVAAVAFSTAACSTGGDASEKSARSSSMQTTGDPRIDNTGYFTATLGSAIASVDSFHATVEGDPACNTHPIDVDVVFRFGESSRDVLEVESIDVASTGSSVSLIVGGSEGGRYGVVASSASSTSFPVETRFDIHAHHYIEGRLMFGMGSADSNIGELGTSAWCQQTIPFAIVVE
jgi:hypothetical protein